MVSHSILSIPMSVLPFSGLYPKQHGLILKFLLGVFFSLVLVPYRPSLAEPAPGIEPISCERERGQTTDGLGESNSHIRRKTLGTSTLEVSAFDEMGNLMEGINIYAFFESDPLHINTRFETTDLDGVAELILEVPGRYLVGAGFQQDPFLISPPGVEVELTRAGQVESVSLTMSSGGLIEGAVIGDGTSVQVGHVSVYSADAQSVFDQDKLVSGIGLGIRDDLPLGTDYRIAVPPGTYRVLVTGALSAATDTWGFVDECAFDRYDLSQADPIVVPAVRKSVRVDFELARGARIGGMVFVNLPEGGTEPACGIRVEALDAISLQPVVRTTATWSPPCGLFSLSLPAGNYLLRARSAIGTYLFEPVYYDQVLDPEQGQILSLGDFETRTNLDFYGQAIVRTLGDVFLDGRIDGLDLFLFASVWGTDAGESVISLLANCHDDPPIDARDLLTWLEWKQ